MKLTSRIKCTFSKRQQHNHEGEEEDLDGDSVNLHYPGDSLLLFRSLYVVITKFVMISYIGSKYFAETTLVSFLSSYKFSLFLFFSGVREWSQAGYQPMIYPMMMMVPCPQVKDILLALVKNFRCQIDCVKLALTLFH